MDKDLYNNPDISNAELVNRDTFERLMAKKRRRRIFRRINYILLSIVMCLVFIAVCMALFLKIERIEVKGNLRYDGDKIIEASGIRVGQNLYAINKKKARSLIQTEYPYINNVVIRRTLPSTLTFTVTEEEPVYYTVICGEYFILSSTLRVLGRTEVMPRNDGERRLIMLKLSDIKSVIVGEQIEFDKELSFDYISSFIAEVTEHKISEHLTEIDMSKKYNIYINYQDRFRIYMGDNTETEMKLTFAELMIDKFEPEQTGLVDVHDITVGSVILDK
ncbi:MAG: FtsQ-type POTRA domain-containing protein [Ruminococcaceae bacterium]|nr:FtsQ-type POTRA domain-containing protein [Oscillospiraceae bacterium]